MRNPCSALLAHVLQQSSSSLRIGRLFSCALSMALIAWSTPERSLAQVATWRVGNAPALSIGNEDSGPTRDLFGVRGAIRLEDGRIVVADAGERLFVLRPDGTYLRTWGGPGRGPGEFDQLLWLQRLPGDTLLAFDSGNNRLSYFTADRGFIRSITPSFVPSLRFVGSLIDGGHVGWKSVPGSAGDLPASNEIRVLRGQIELSLFDSGSEVLRSLGTVAGSESVSGRLSVRSPDTPFRNTLIAVAPRRIYVATGDRFEVMVLSPEGRSLATIRRGHEPIPVSREQLMEFLEDGPWTWRVPQNARWNWPEGRSRPAVVDLRVDDAGNLWVEEGREDPNASGLWSVFDPAGRHVADVTMPPRFRPFHIGLESVLGVWRDDLDVEYVQSRAIAKNGNP